MLKDIQKIAKRQGQAIVEFAFCMIIVFLMAFGLIRIFKWTATDLINRRKAHDTMLVSPIDPSYGSGPAANAGPLNQISPAFYYPTSMNGIVGE